MPALAHAKLSVYERKHECAHQQVSKLLAVQAHISALVCLCQGATAIALSWIVSIGLHYNIKQYVKH